jgi:dienelactone hydrolase
MSSRRRRKPADRNSAGSFRSRASSSKCIAKAGRATADSIQAAVDHLTAQPFVRKSGVIVAGQSAGGWGTLALASRNPRMVAAAINYAGGRGGRVDDQPGTNCAPERLVRAAAEFGRTAQIPTLWIMRRTTASLVPRCHKACAPHTAIPAAAQNSTCCLREAMTGTRSSLPMKRHNHGCR